MSKHFVVLVAGICQAGMEDYVAQHLKSIMQHSRKHPGCFIYNIHQSKKNTKEFMMYSEWENEEAFEAHNETAAIDKLSRLRRQLCHIIHITLNLVYDVHKNHKRTKSKSWNF